MRLKLFSCKGPHAYNDTYQCTCVLTQCVHEGIYFQRRVWTNNEHASETVQVQRDMLTEIHINEHAFWHSACMKEYISNEEYELIMNMPLKLFSCKGSCLQRYVSMNLRSDTVRISEGIHLQRSVWTNNEHVSETVQVQRVMLTEIRINEHAFWHSACMKEYISNEAYELK